MIIAIDPGKNKCGLAVLDENGNTLEKKVISRGEIASVLPPYLAKYATPTLVVGRSHSGKELEREILKLDLNIHVIFISEKYSSVEARKRYWRENRPKGLWLLIPTSLRLPPVPVDDYAAVILGERYLKD